MMSWKDCVFTLDELHGHLIKNFVKYPVPAGEEREWLEEVIYGLWRAQKELARVAGGELPTIINAEIDDRQHYGIVTPMRTGTDTNIEYDLMVMPMPEVVEVPTDDEPIEYIPAEPAQEIALVSIENMDSERVGDIAPLAVRPSDIAAHIFDQYIQSQVESPKFDIAHIMSLFNCSEFVNVQPKEVRDVIRAMAESGYIHSYTTGKNKSRRTWWCMDADVKSDVLDDIVAGSFHECLPDLFDDQEAVA